MSRVSNITGAHIEAIIESLEGPTSELHHISDRILKGHVDPIEKPLEKARALLSIGQAAQEVARQIIIRASMDEDRAELEKMLRERAAQKA
jgi:hypothetical protein